MLISKDQSVNNFKKKVLQIINRSKTRSDSVVNFFVTIIIIYFQLKKIKPEYFMKDNKLIMKTKRNTQWYLFVLNNKR